ncbi:OsmC family protein [Adhaeribacter sp. BT258]|uniref:OsmC family protein n=1 Tax=Adhaeribacter terrigena TaxID=2793070 RepID=A0ABS1C4N7_9BACT|nr:OsmC family protein [Adhaeribacter terrigena]MBK0404137.1 OsmC family protein [Adhaeribacter terrigena]
MRTLADTRILLPNQVSASLSEPRFLTKIRVGKHSFVVDEPEDMGGANAGPQPQHMILSALGSCAAITLRMYADHKAWPLTQIDVKLQFEGEAESENQLMPNIKMQLLVQGNLSPEQLERLTVIAQKCPVHKSLSPAFKISTTLALALPEYP